VALFSAIAGGTGNAITAAYATISGGTGSKVSGIGGSVGGGESNLASGNVATIPGGYHNVAAGAASFAAGFHAEALHNGSFVWSDQSTSTAFAKSTAANQFVARAAGGVYFYSNPGLTAGVRLSPGSGTWGSLSDRNMKTGIVPLDDTRILDKLAALPVSEWSYTSERGVRHIGPMAQDFYAAFGVGEDDRHITTIDEDGVALAAVKALHAENVSLRAENRSLRARDTAFAARMASDESAITALRLDVARLAAASGTHR
jgi:hypothetical protein